MNITMFCNTKSLFLKKSKKKNVRKVEHLAITMPLA